MSDSELLERLVEVGVSREPQHDGSEQLDGQQSPGLVWCIEPILVRAQDPLASIEHEEDHGEVRVSDPDLGQRATVHVLGEGEQKSHDTRDGRNRTSHNWDHIFGWLEPTRDGMRNERRMMFAVGLGLFKIRMKNKD